MTALREIKLLKVVIDRNEQTSPHSISQCLPCTVVDSEHLHAVPRSHC